VQGFIAAPKQDLTSRAATEAAAARHALEESVAAEAIAIGEKRWASDYATIERAEAAATSASVFRRSAAQREIEAARAHFQARHNAAPTPTPTAARKSGWARAATTPGAHSGLDAARTREQAAIAHHARLTMNPAPGERPIAPRPGTPDQEARKDAIYAAQRAGQTARQEAAAERPEQSSR